MRLRTCAWLLVLPLLLLGGTASADTFWFTATDGVAGEVNSVDFDPATATFTYGAAVTVAPGPLVDPAYLGPTAAVQGIDTMVYGSGVSPALAYADGKFVCIVDTDPASATYRQVIQTIDMSDTSVGTETFSCQFLKFHPGGGRIYVSCLGTGATPHTIRIARIVSPLPTLEYDFFGSDHTGYPNDILDNLASGEWTGIPSDGLTGGTAHRPLGIDINPSATKVFFTCHQESAALGVMHSAVHLFTIDASGDWTGSGNVAEVPPSATFHHPFQIAISPSTLDFAAGGSRAHVTNCAGAGVPVFAPPSPGFVMLVNSGTDVAVSRVVTGTVAPPNIDPATWGGPGTGNPFISPWDVDWTSTGTASYVSDVDETVTAPPEDDGMIAEWVVPASTPAIDYVAAWFDDPSPAIDTHPAFGGLAVDNDDAEIVFCEQSAAEMVAFDVSGVFLTSLANPSGMTPLWIAVQSGTGAGGGGGGPPPGPGGSPTNDNGAETVGSDEYDDDDGGGHKKWYQCFVATASWGRESRPVGELISFRSDWIHGAQAGRVFDRMYYGFGPKLAGQITAHDAQPVGQVVLAPFAYAARGGAVTGAVAAILIALLVAMAVRRVL